MIPIAFQPFSVHEAFRKDFAGTVKEVAKIGYDGIELACTPFDWKGDTLSVKERQKIVSDLGMKVSCMHAKWEELDRTFDRVVEDAATFQTVDVVIPWRPPEIFTSAEKIIELGELLGAMGAKLHKAGLHFSYHNHNYDYKVWDGLPGVEWMMQVTAPQNLSVEVDTYWVYHSGNDPVKAISRLGTRARFLHLKDGSMTKQTELGSGDIDFRGIFDVCEKVGSVKWYIVEQEQFNFAPMESMRLNLEYIKRLTGA